MHLLIVQIIILYINTIHNNLKHVQTHTKFIDKDGVFYLIRFEQGLKKFMFAS